jgi:hypothetical protein
MSIASVSSRTIRLTVAMSLPRLSALLGIMTDATGHNSTSIPALITQQKQSESTESTESKFVKSCGVKEKRTFGF